jgi:hypothetical protein
MRPSRPCLNPPPSRLFLDQARDSPLLTLQLRRTQNTAIHIFKVVITCAGAGGIYSRVHMLKNVAASIYRAGQRWSSKIEFSASCDSLYSRTQG